MLYSPPPPTHTHTHAHTHTQCHTHTHTHTVEPLVLERETERMDEGGGEREGAREEGQGTSCEVLPGEEAEVLVTI